MIGLQAPCPVDGVELLLAEDEGILFDAIGQRLFRLNSFASCIWCHIEEGLPAAEVVAATARSLNLEPAETSGFVSGMIEKWQRLGLLRGGQAPRPAIREPRQTASGVLPPASAYFQGAAVTHVRRRYQMLDTIFSLGFSNPMQEALLCPVLAHLETGREEPNSCRLDLRQTADGVYLLQDGHPLGFCATNDGLVPMVQGNIGLLALRRYPYLMALHSAGLATPDGVLLIAGSSGSGKTTLAAALLASGWGYLSDDTILLRPHTLDAVGVPYSLGIKASAWSLLTSRYPSLDRAAIHRRQDGKAIRYHSPPRENYALPRTVCWVVFPHRSANPTSAIRPLARLEGLQRLFEHCCAIPHSLTHRDVRSLIQWSSRVSFLDMKVADLNSATALLHRVAARGASDATKPEIPLLAESAQHR